MFSPSLDTDLTWPQASIGVLLTCLSAIVKETVLWASGYPDSKWVFITRQWSFSFTEWVTSLKLLVSQKGISTREGVQPGIKMAWLWFLFFIYLFFSPSLDGCRLWSLPNRPIVCVVWLWLPCGRWSSSSPWWHRSCLASGGTVWVAVDTAGEMGGGGCVLQVGISLRDGGGGGGGGHWFTQALYLKVAIS